MTGYHPEAFRRRTREHLVKLVQQPGFHDYALDAARKYEKQDPALHGGLEAEVRRAIKAQTPTNPRRP